MGLARGYEVAGGGQSGGLEEGVGVGCGRGVVTPWSSLDISLSVIAFA